MILQIVAYKCTFCKRVFQRQHAAIMHDGRCLYNPEKMACLSCDNFHGIEAAGENRYCSLYKFLRPRKMNCEGWVERTKEYGFWIRKPDGEIRFFQDVQNDEDARHDYEEY